jgi:hypothetical protein
VALLWGRPINKVELYILILVPTQLLTTAIKSTKHAIP